MVKIRKNYGAISEGNTKLIHRQTDRETDRQTDRQAERQKDRKQLFYKALRRPYALIPNLVLTYLFYNCYLLKLKKLFGDKLNL